MGIIRWLADRVQHETGEDQRRKNVAKIKELVQLFKEKVTAAIGILNATISKFNERIKCLNKIRSDKVGSDIIALEKELQFYGNCNLPVEFVEEYSKDNYKFPEREYASLNEYIGEIDWSNDEVFWNTLLRSPIGMRWKTKKENLSLTESANLLQLKIDETIRELNEIEFATNIDIEVCDSYIENISFISDIIRTVIIPELYIIHAFFQSEKIKNVVLSNNALTDGVSFSYDINSLVGTKYQRHYQFIKNAYAFYVLSCRIYNTPVLTHLLAHTSSEIDIQNIGKEKSVLTFQAKNVKGSLIFEVAEA